MMHYHTAFSDENGMVSASAPAPAHVAITDFLAMARRIFKDQLDGEVITEYAMNRYVEMADTRILWVGTPNLKLMFAPCECQVNPFMN